MRLPLSCECAVYLMDVGMHGSYDGAPWSHFLVGEFGANASAMCDEMRTSPMNARYFTPADAELYAWEHNSSEPDPRVFDSCLYARESQQKMSLLDILILLVAFMLLGLEAARDQREQTEARFLAMLSCPWSRPTCTIGSISMCLARCCMKFLDTIFSLGVPALIPTAMLMLLTVQGCNSTDIILNGLSVGFVLELDNHVADTFLSNEYDLYTPTPKRLAFLPPLLTCHVRSLRGRMREEIETYFTKLGRQGLPKDLAGRDIVRRPFEVPARFVGMLFAFFAGFHRATSLGSDISCEMNFCICREIERCFASRCSLTQR